MKTIDTSQWGHFLVGDLFDIHPTKAYKMTNKDLFEVEGDSPVVVNTGFNNGIGGYTYKACTEKAGTITFTDTAAKSTDSFFYHETDFVGYPHVQGMYTKDHVWNKYESLFLISVIKATIKNQYDFISKMTRKEILTLDIQLPVTTDNLPDWKYMNQYMQDIESKASANLCAILKAKMSAKNVSIDGWHSFHLYDIFDIDAGTKLDKIKMDVSVSEINFVGRSNANNGITAEIAKIEGIEPYAAGNLTLALGGAYLGSCFVQPKEFYTSQNVVVLTPKTNISDSAKRFIATAIFVESQNNYKAFIDELNAHIKTDFEIKLPVDNNNNPDWKFMDEYMSQIEDKARSNLALLS